MIHRVLLDTAETPDGGKELRLYQHDKDFFILAENEDLMSSRMHESEDQLARITTERITHRKQPTVLIGGLGMGFTLRAALDGLPESAKVVVAELVPAVVNWNRGLLAHLAGNPLADKRVEIQEIDVAKILRKTKNHYDAILLDVDNGPSGLSRKSNDWFYGMSGLYAARGALKSGGLAIHLLDVEDYETKEKKLPNGLFSVPLDRWKAKLTELGVEHKEVIVKFGLALVILKNS